MVPADGAVFLEYEGALKEGASLASKVLWNWRKQEAGQLG
jgi:hypothetical protein